jgi:hypothetical protein
MLGEISSYVPADTCELGQEEASRVIEEIIKVWVAFGRVFPGVTVEEHIDEHNAE